MPVDDPRQRFECRTKKLWLQGAGMEWPLPTSRQFSALAKSIAEAPTKCKKSDLKTHQRVLATFLGRESPYRGLVVIHGLGSGKTLSAVSVIASSWSPERPRAWVILPASLKANFVAELKGDRAAAEFECASWRQVEGKWKRHNAGTPYDQLSEDDRAEVSARVAEEIEDSVRFLSLNGLTRKLMSSFETAEVNPFDNAVVIVDECHIMMQAVAKSGHEATLTKRLYDLLYDAKGAKLVLLSATPLINVPREMAYLVNLCHGPILRTSVKWRKPLQTKQAADAKIALLSSPFVSEADTSASAATFQLTPRGFVMASRSKGTVTRSDGKEDAFKSILKSVSKYVAKDAVLQTKKFDLFPPDEFEASFVGPTGDLIRKTMLARRMRGCVSYFMQRDESLFPSATYRIHAVPMSDTQYTFYSAARAAERELEEQGRERDEELSVHRSYSRASLNFVFPAKDAIKVYKRDIRAALKADSRSAGKKDVEREHQRQMAYNVKRLKNSPIWNDDALLAQQSSKFAAVLHALQDRPGNAMLYSAFRALEGLGLMAHLLLKRGFRQLVVTRTEGKRRFALAGSGRGPAFVLPVLNTDDGDDMLRLFNSESQLLNPEMLASATRLFGKDLDNRRGRLVKLVMLSASGSKGINLKCVRQVHILEPHWHETQLEQVAGRAVRMLSHAALPPEERTVEVTTYIGTFSDAQKAAPEFELFAKLDRGMTSDEALVDIAARKKYTLDKLLRVMASTAVDCRMWGESCYDPPDVFGTHVPVPADIHDDSEDPVKKVKAARFAVPVPGGKAVVHVHSAKVYNPAGKHIGDVINNKVVWIKGPPSPDS